MDGPPSPGEVGGIFAGLVALLALFGGGIKFLVNLGDARAQTRTAKLDAWHREIVERERAFEAKVDAHYRKIEADLDALEGRVEALRLAYEHVATPLRILDPENDGLKKAEQILQAAFPLVPRIPPDMGGSLNKLD